MRNYDDDDELKDDERFCFSLGFFCIRLASKKTFFLFKATTVHSKKPHARASLLGAQGKKRLVFVLLGRKDSICMSYCVHGCLWWLIVINQGGPISGIIQDVFIRNPH